MRKSALLSVIFFLFNIILSSAQTDLAYFDLRIRSPKDAFGVAGDNGEVGFVVQGSKQYHLSILNPQHQVEKNIIANRIKGDKKDKIIGGLINKNIFTVFLYNKRSHIISTISADRGSSLAKITKVKAVAQNDQYLKAFTMNDKFFLLMVPKHQNVIKIWTSEDGASFEESTYNIEMPSFYSSLSNNNGELNDEIESAVGVKEVKYDLDNNTKSTYFVKKLYHENGMIYLTLDDPNTTHVIIIDDGSKKATYKKLNFTLERGNNSGRKQGNSYFYRNKLFRATVSPDQLNLSVVDLEAMQLLSSYNEYPEKDIDILNGPIVQEGSAGSFATDEKVIKKSSQWFKRAMSGNLAVAANKIDSNRFEVEIGAYEEFTNRGSGFAGPGLSIGMGMGMGMGGFGYSPYGYYPGSFYGPGYYPGYSPYSSYGSSVRLRVTYFRTLLNGEDFHHIPGVAPKSVREKIIEFQENMRYSPDLEVVVPANENTVLFGYYNKYKDVFQIVEFKKNFVGITKGF